MVGATLAISDFMLMLLTSALWVGSGVVVVALLGLGCAGGLGMCARRWGRARENFPFVTPSHAGVQLPSGK